MERGGWTDADEARRWVAKLRRSGRNRESYDEVVELEAKLRAAYVAKELEVQILEREAERYAAEMKERRAAESMRSEGRAMAKEEARERWKNVEDRERYRKELMDQMEGKKEERRLRMEEERWEREVLREVDRAREERERSERSGRRKEMGEIASRERFVVSEMRRLRGEEEREAEAARRREEEEYWWEVGERRRRAEESRIAELRERESMRRKIADALIDAEDRKREREALLAELITEDVKLELSMKEEEEETERERRKEELAADLKEQIVFTERCKLRFVERDREFAEEVMRRIKEDEKIGRLSAEARRRAQLRYRDELNRLIEIRRKIREEEIWRKKRALEEEKEREKMRSDRDKEERKRLLEKHAPNVANFIDKIPLSEEERETIERMQTNADPCQ
ncbi:meiosis-specific nuclear structural protein 1-like [Apis laboriosa]|uniref:meiosis-specific nuclear structural protein 1-like n=1 Tax=Apis laboriosa TaxID=183418 RepID=UPI001CC51357|nr:meiosis-specific nuclear structural protein 1-like [Apis laboriosa]